MASVSDILSPSKTKTPRYAQYHGYAGIATMSTEGTLIFRTTESGWVAVLDQADLVLLGANPRDIHNTQRINSVVQNGRLMDRKALAKMLGQ